MVTASTPDPDDAEVGAVLVVDDDVHQRRLLERWLTSAGHRVECHDDGLGCVAALARTLPDVVLLDLHMPQVGGLEVLPELRARSPRVPVVVLTSDAEVDTVVRAMQAGAFDFLTKPVTRPKLLTTVRNAVSHGRMSTQLAQLARDRQDTPFAGLVGRAPSMRGMFREMERVAKSDITVLIQGESGTGKELVARALHDHSGRRDKPFIALNCAAIPETLQESELFGHERGAFTGATTRRAGRFEQAHGGTLFLDEVGELSPPLQAKLLRVVQERRFFRVGGNAEVAVDVRLLAATHRDLEASVSEGRFREDLYYRLAVFELAVPPLRDRPGDAAVLATHFLRALAARHRRAPLSLSPEVAACLHAFGWPGNVRQLQNALERAVVVAEGPAIRLQDLPKAVRQAAPADLERPADPADAGRAYSAPAAPVADPLAGLTLHALERRAIEASLDRHAGNVSDVSRELGIPRTTLYRKLKKHGMR